MDRVHLTRILLGHYCTLTDYKEYIKKRDRPARFDRPIPVVPMVLVGS
jgi:hypothetical protein